MRKDYGLLQVYTGTGKGKTTAALGVALRAAGSGAKVVILCFLKDDATYGEVKGCQYLPNVTIKQVGRNEFVNFKDPEPIDLQLAAQGWAEAQKILLAGDTDILILDELNIALAHNLLKTQDIVKFLQAHKGHTEVITTGRDAPKELLAIADLITDMQEVKHYYTRGVGIRDGIDH